MARSSGETEPDARIVDRWTGGVSWIADPTETIQRTSHALVADGEVWLVDPVDFDGLDALASDLGTVAGVVVLLDRHKRDAAAVANRHEVPVTVPATMSGVARALDAPAEWLTVALGDTDYRSITVVDNPFWKEVALYDAGSGTLVVPEAVGTVAYYRVGSERLGVHPGLRFFPPRRALSGLAPERVLVGHGEGVFTDAAAALEDALERSRRNAPRLYVQTLGQLLGG